MFSNQKFQEIKVTAHPLITNDIKNSKGGIKHSGALTELTLGLILTSNTQ